MKKNLYSKKKELLKARIDANIAELQQLIGTADEAQGILKSAKAKYIRARDLIKKLELQMVDAEAQLSTSQKEFERARLRRETLELKLEVDKAQLKGIERIELRREERSDRNQFVRKPGKKIADPEPTNLQ